MLMHVKKDEDAPLLGISARSSGVVFSGAKAARRREDFRRASGFAGPCLIDPAAYEEETATAEAPFALSDLGMFDDGSGLAGEVDWLRRQGASPVLTPTRYFTATGREPLQEAARLVDALGADDVVFVVPVDAAWLDGGRADLLAELLRRVRTPKALVLGHSHDPLAKAGRAAALRRIVTSVPDIAVLRTDLAGFDSAVYGARYTSIGDRASVRHTRPPSKGGGGGAPASPNLLVPALMSYRSGAFMARTLSRVDLPCPCGPCSADTVFGNGGVRTRRLTDFIATEDTAAAHAHNWATLARWWSELSAADSPRERAIRWARMCHAAVAENERFNELAGTPGRPFHPSLALKHWAGKLD